MLSRAAQRHTRLRTIRSYNAAREQLYLPWLCPTYPRLRQPCYRSLTTAPGESTAPLRKRRNSNDGANPTVRRSLATAAHMPLTDEIPFADSINQVASKYPGHSQDESRLSTIMPFDPTKTISLENTLALPAERMRLKNGVTGEQREIFAILEACLRLGRIERAAAIIKRSVPFLKLSPEELGRLHNEYLKASLERILREPNAEHAHDMHKWFEVMVRSKGIEITAATIAIMLKTSLQSPRGARQDRLVKRYMDMARGDVGLEVLSMVDIMSAEDLDIINQIAPDHNILAKLDSLVDEEPNFEDDIAAADLESSKTTPEVIMDVRSAPQRGFGLKALKQSLSLFSRKPEGFDAEVLTVEEQRLRQMKLEEDSITSAVDRWRKESVSLSKMGLDTSLQTKSLGARMWKWQELLEQRLTQELKNIDKAEATPEKEKSQLDVERCIYGPFLRYLPTDKLAAVTILTSMQCLSSHGTDKGMPLAAVIMSIGANLEDESITETIRNNTTKQGWQQLNKTASAGKGQGLARVIRNKKTRQQLTDSLAKLVRGDSAAEHDLTDQWNTEWSATIKAKVGSYLLSALIDTAKVPVTVENTKTQEILTQIQPAFSHTHQYKIGKKTGMILANRALVASLKREPVHSLLAKHLPMVAEPEPWSQFNQGGFISHPAKAVRIKGGDKNQRHYQEAAIGRGDMEQMFKGLDVLGKTPWVINRPVFDTMLEAWNTGEAIANFPAEEPKLEYPPEPPTSKDPTERRKWIRSLKTIENTRSGFHSARCFQNFQLEIARSLRDEKFYFPHNLDFRGRAYPIPPYLNHMGADHCRGLLKFGKGRELGEAGLKWLRVHLANVHGYDKASLKEREQYTVDHIDDIYDSAMNPLQGRRWWLDAEDPWQCLAACHELKNALDSGDPTKFVSHLPVHQDGTCNGLQHYAALGGDEWGARQVNLEPGDRPADVYSAVAELVKEKMAIDRKNGNKCAIWLEGKIKRKVVKQTVMTNVYGVTYIGAQAQVRKQLVAAHSDIPNEGTFNVSLLSGYVATKIFEALGTMFRGAHDIQYWLGECASRISTSITPEQLDKLEQLHEEALDKRAPRQNRYQTSMVDAEQQLQFKSSVVWTTPLRMPIVQPYRATKSRTVHTNLQQITISEPHRSDPVSKRKQLQGFPPNFVHSLDATHMMLSALKCDEAGLSFAAVHDSFWTHAADIDTMNGVLRDAFIQMHSDNVIVRLAAEFDARYKGSLYLAHVKSDSEFFRRVQEWRADVKSGRIENPYRVSGSNKSKKQSQKNMQLVEALLERKRARLLASEDPERVAEGKAMVTPASIFEELQAYNDIKGGNDTPVVGLGEKGAAEPKKKAKAEAVDMENEDVDENEEQEEPEEEDDSEGEMEVEHDADDGGSEKQDAFSRSVSKKRVRSKGAALSVWLPVAFPTVPEKGSFDVKRLKNSQYFFS
ncbi:hypothetical protein V496_09838 [Pseudogymnoascus sp. VKM F-4515 (FW-2607)]|nr:hypothetical protein V496_09838 [Pseudogymnoascus sp. VKM F-4515 (FW-2607)]KFY76242.1 hypothetical protein V498_09653 [Pseudogymnoascus sp. VKM F-4517 (FW-2822)]